MRVTWRALCLLSWGLLARRTFGLPANCWRAAVGLQVRAAIVSEQANAVAIAAVADQILFRLTRAMHFFLVACGS